jgi:hypothetical protein
VPKISGSANKNCHRSRQAGGGLDHVNFMSYLANPIDNSTFRNTKDMGQHVHGSTNMKEPYKMSSNIHSTIMMCERTKMQFTLNSDR